MTISWSLALCRVVLFSLLFTGPLTLAVDRSAYSESKYRQDQPVVLEPQPALSPNGDERGAPEISTEALRRAYAAAGRPRLAVFFGRKVSANPSSWIPGKRGLAKDATPDADLKSGINIGASGGRWSHLTEIERERVRAGLESELLANRVRLLDRAMILRLQARDGRDADLQKLEIEALAGQAELVLVAYDIYDPQSPLSAAWRLTILSVADGAILLSDLIRGSALDTQAEARWVAASGGFEKVTSKEDLVLEEIGHALARALMVRLWR